MIIQNKMKIIQDRLVSLACYLKKKSKKTFLSEMNVSSFLRKKWDRMKLKIVLLLLLVFNHKTLLLAYFVPNQTHKIQTTKLFDTTIEF